MTLLSAGGVAIISRSVRSDCAFLAGSRLGILQLVDFTSAADGVILRTKNRQSKRLRRVSQTTPTRYVRVSLVRVMPSRVVFSASRSAHLPLHDSDGFATFFQFMAECRTLPYALHHQKITCHKRRNKKRRNGASELQRQFSSLVRDTSASIHYNMVNEFFLAGRNSVLQRQMYALSRCSLEYC